MRMKHLWLTILLCLASTAAQATFELRDPAGEVYEEKQEMKRSASKEKSGSSVICTMEPERGRCFCFGKETGRELPVSHEQCVAITSKLLDPQVP